MNYISSSYLLLADHAVVCRFVRPVPVIADGSAKVSGQPRQEDRAPDGAEHGQLHRSVQVHVGHTNVSSQIPR